jgi:hypothetical protein
MLTKFVTKVIRIADLMLPRVRRVVNGATVVCGEEACRPPEQIPPTLFSSSDTVVSTEYAKALEAMGYVE